MLASRRILVPTYLVCTALIALPLVDVFTTLYPWRFLEPRWRFGAVGLVSSALLLPMAGVLLAFACAVSFRQRGLARIIGYLAAGGGGACLLSLAMFGLDALQTRASVRPDMVLPFNVAAITAAAKTLLAGTTLLAIAWSALRGRGRPTDARELATLFSKETAPPSMGSSTASG